MSSKVLFLGESDKHIMKITNTDHSVTSTPAFANNLEFIWIVNTSPGDVVTHTRDYVLSAAETFLKIVENDLSLLQYHYTYEATMPLRGRSLKTRGSGGCSGFHVDGKACAIWGGMGECYVDEYGILPDGKRGVVRATDVRDRKRVETDDWGPIKIFRRKKKLTWPEVLPPLIEFLKQLPDEEVRIRVLWEKPKLMDLVRSADKGGGEKDWAEGELYEIGDKAKTELLEKLQDPKASKYYVTIARLLVTLFPSSEAKEAVERLRDQETKESARATYSLLLKTLG